jgi:NitT/TauT family transport system substrate-binding protein
MRIFKILGLLLVISVVSACSNKNKQSAAGGASSVPGATANSVKQLAGHYVISYAGSICGSPISIAYDNGYYKEEGVDVELVSGNTFDTNRAFLDSGKTPVINGDFQFFPAIYNGANIKLISGLHEGCIKVLVPKDSPIKTFADLKGKTIGVDEIGGTPMSVASIEAGFNNINPQTEITWKPFPGDQLTLALQKGEVDAISDWDPYMTEAEETGNYRTLLDIAKDPPFAGKNCCFLFASGKLVKENPEVVARVLRAIQKAVKFEGEHPEEAAKILIAHKRIGTDDAGLTARLLKSFHYERHYTEASNLQAKTEALFFATQLTKIGYLPADLDVNKFVDNMWVDIFALAKQAEQTENAKQNG